MADANSTLVISTRRGDVLIDAADEHLFTGCRARIFVTHDGYAKFRSTFVHRILTGAQPGQIVDHINGNPLDNRRCNLRICTTAENLRNGSSHADSAVKYRGVSISPDRPNRKWRAQICLNYKVMLVGRYDTAEEAARAYDQAARRLFGEFARLNFPS